MKVLHITNAKEAIGYEEVELIANRINERNHLALIIKDGKKYMTGGILLNDTPKIREILDSMPKEEQYDFIVSIKLDPYVKSYADENDLKEF